MSCYKSSVEALQQLLQLGTSDRKIGDKMKNSLAGCQITKTSSEISYMRNGIEYCFVEVHAVMELSMDYKLMDKKPTNSIKKRTGVECVDALL